MKSLTKTATLLALSLCLTQAVLTPVAQASESLQDHAVTRQVAKQFLQTQSAGLPGDVSVSVGTIDSRLRLASCQALEAFFPANSRAWGRTSVGVRCLAPTPWTIYIASKVQVEGNYLVAANPLGQNQIISLQDITQRKGDLTALPTGILTDPEQAIGRTVARSMSSGMPLRQDALRILQAVRQGQTVRLVSSGPGFSISAEAKALTSASEGEMIQAKTPAGQIVSGIAKLGGIVEVSY